MIGWLVNSDLEMIWKKTIVVCQLLLRLLPGMTDENWSQCWTLNTGPPEYKSSVLQTRTLRSVVHIYQENKMDVHDTSSWKVPEYRTRSISKPGIALKILNAGSWRFACSNLHSKSETHTARFSFTWIALLAKLPITQSALKAEASASGKLQCTAPVMLTL